MLPRAAPSLRLLRLLRSLLQRPNNAEGAEGCCAVPERQGFLQVGVTGGHRRSREVTGGHGRSLCSTDLKLVISIAKEARQGIGYDRGISGGKYCHELAYPLVAIADHHSVSKPQ